MTKKIFIIYKREFLIIKKNFKKWKYYIENNIITVVHTNYADLQYIKIIVKFFKRLIKWLIEFKKYKFNIRYKFEIEMIVSNILSKKSDYKFWILEVNLYTINFDNIIIIYAHNNILFNEIEWNVWLKWFEDWFKINDDN